MEVQPGRSIAGPQVSFQSKVNRVPPRRKERDKEANPLCFGHFRPGPGLEQREFGRTLTHGDWADIGAAGVIDGQDTRGKGMAD